MKYWFKVLIENDKLQWIRLNMYEKEYSILEYSFSIMSYSNIKVFKEMLQEVTSILNGEMVQDEPWGIRDWQPSGDILIDKEKVVYDLTETDGTHYHIEIPTLDFKQLLENWNKFVEINSQAFS